VGDDGTGGATAVAGLPQGVRSRPLHPGDTDRLLEIATAVGAAHGRPPTVSRADFDADFASPDLDLARDTFAAIDSDGRLLLGMFCYLSQPGRVWLDPVIEPDLDDAMTAALLDAGMLWGLARGFDDAAERSLTEVIAEAGGLRGEQRLFSAYERAGLSHARTYWRMERELSVDDSAQHVGLPPGVELVKVDPEDGDVMRRLQLVDEAAFAEHHGFVPLAADAYDRAVRLGSGYDRDGAWVAQLDGEDVGLMLLNDSRADQNQGWIAVIGVLRAARGRGIARAMLHEAFGVYARRGRTSVGLSVDTLNATGAPLLYESVGMRPAEIVEHYELPLTVGTGTD
jgi:ribosomal protein S18 acetylase RimI-like enzyme